MDWMDDRVGEVQSTNYGANKAEPQQTMDYLSHEGVLAKQVDVFKEEVVEKYFDFDLDLDENDLQLLQM